MSSLIDIVRDRSATSVALHPEAQSVVLDLAGVGVAYSGQSVLRDVTMSIPERQITAFIGPSGCGKSTLLRSLNRMNDLIAGARVTGALRYHGEDLYGDHVDPLEVRRRIGMVFQKPNPFPKSIYDNVAYGPRVTKMVPTSSMDDLVEDALRRAALWDEVKGKLRSSALSLSGGQQQRLCIARCIAGRPEVILMDEPCSALDPIATRRIEALMLELRDDFTIVVVTHNMQQAARVADHTAFFSTEALGDEEPVGTLVEFAPTLRLFDLPSDQRTLEYITGRVG